MRKASVAASVVTDMLDYLGRRGVAADDMARAVSLPLATAGAEERVSGSIVERL